MRRTSQATEKLRIHLLRYLSAAFFIFLTVVEVLGCRDQVNKSSELREASVLEEDKKSSDEQNSGVPAHQGSIFVHVCGEVCTPGVYELQEGSRIYEALEAAGGMTKDAASVYLNQAEKVSDGQQIVVPSKKDIVEQTENMQTAQTENDGRVNINTASKEELMTLNGIGEVKAEAIIRYREEKGAFHSIEELKEIEGIKDGVFHKVKDQIKV